MIRKFFDGDGGYIADGEPIFLSGKGAGGTPRFHAAQEKDPHSRSVLDDPNSSLTKLSKDRKLMQMVREGKGDDKGIKRESLAIERENATKSKRAWYEKKKKKIETIKRKLKMKWRTAN